MLAAPLLVEKSFSIFSEVHALPPLDGGRGALGLPTLSRPDNATGMLWGEKMDEELAMEARETRDRSGIATAEWEEELFSELKRSAMTPTAATASRSPIIFHSDHLTKLATVFELFISPHSVVWRLWEGAAEGSSIRVAVGAIAAVVGREGGGTARARGTEAFLTIRTDGVLLLSSSSSPFSTLISSRSPPPRTLIGLNLQF